MKWDVAAQNFQGVLANVVVWMRFESVYDLGESRIAAAAVLKAGNQSGLATKYISERVWRAMLKKQTSAGTRHRF